MLGVVSSILRRLHRLSLDLQFVDVCLDEHLNHAEDGMDAADHNE